MKKIGIILLSFFAVIIIVVIVALVLLPNIARGILEKEATKFIGAKVDIQNISVDYFKPAVTIHKIQVTNPYSTMTNIIDIGDIKLQVNIFSIIKGEYVVDTIQILNVQADTPRKTDGAIKAKQEVKKDNGINGEQDIFNQDLFSSIKNFDYKKYINEDLKTVKTIAALKDDSIKIYDKWKADFDSIKYNEDIAKIYNDVQNFNVSINNPQDAVLKMNKLNEYRLMVNKYTNEFNSKKTAYQNEATNISKNIKNLDNEAQNELNSIMDKANIKNISVDNVAKLIFSDQALNYVNQAVFWVNKLGKESFSSKKDEQPKKKDKPIKFNIKNIKLTLINKDTLIKGFPVITGEVFNISDDMDRTKNPVVGKLEISIPDLTGARVEINILIDRRNKSINDAYGISADNFVLKDIKLLGTYGLPDKLTEANLAMDSKLSLIKDTIIVNSDLKINNIKLLYENKNIGELEKIVQSVIKEIDSLSIGVDVKVKDKNTDIKITSNLDKIFAKKIKGIFDKKVAELKSLLDKEFFEFIDPKKEEANKLLNDKKNTVNNLLNTKEKLINSEKQKFDDLIKSKTNELENLKNQLLGSNSTVNDAVKKIPKIF